jgi:hypothetical protein
MYGVPPDVNLEPFVGATLIQVCIGPHDLQLHFARIRPEDGPASVSIWSWFVLIDAGGEVVEEGSPTDVRTKSIPTLLNTAVVAARREDESAVAFVFESGHVLRLVDDSKQYESFLIEPGTVVV